MFKNSTIFGKKVDYDKIVTPVYKLVNTGRKRMTKLSFLAQRIAAVLY